MDINVIKRFYNVNKLSVDEISKKVGFPKEEVEKILFDKEEVIVEVEGDIDEIAPTIETETVEEVVESEKETPKKKSKKKGN